MKSEVNLTYLYGSAMYPTTIDKIGMLSREVYLIKKLSEQFNELHIFSMDTKEVFSDLPPNVFHHIFPFDIGKLTKFAYFLLTPLFYPSIFKKCNLIRANELSAGIPFVIIKKIYRKKGIISYKWAWSDTARMDSTKSYFNYIARKIIEKLTFKNADIIFVPTSKLQEIVERSGIDKNKIILKPEFVDCNVFKKIKNLKNSSDILLIGRFDKIKNYPLVIKAADILSNRGIRARITIIGQGPIKEDIQKLADTYSINLKIIERELNEQIPYHINSALVYVICSTTEGNPKALLEAMSCGVPVIGTNVRGINELIIDSENGLLCEENPESLANAIERVINDPELRDKLGQNARKTIVDTYSDEKILEKEFSVCDMLLKD